MTLASVFLTFSQTVDITVLLRHAVKVVSIAAIVSISTAVAISALGPVATVVAVPAVISVAAPVTITAVIRTVLGLIETL